MEAGPDGLEIIAVGSDRPKAVTAFKARPTGPTDRAEAQIDERRTHVELAEQFGAVSGRKGVVVLAVALAVVSAWLATGKAPLGSVASTAAQSAPAISRAEPSLTSATPAVGQPRPPLGHAGRWITDAEGRVVILHGVNMVYKRPPYAPDAVGFGADDAAFLHRNGFNSMRLGVLYAGVEPQPGVYDRRYLTPDRRHRPDAREVRHLLPLGLPPGHVQPALPGRGGTRLGGPGRRLAGVATARLS